MWYLQAALKNVASLQVVAGAAEGISTDLMGKYVSRSRRASVKARLTIAVHKGHAEVNRRQG